jgi:hypothetical protein
MRSCSSRMRRGKWWLLMISGEDWGNISETYVKCRAMTNLLSFISRSLTAKLIIALASLLDEFGNGERIWTSDLRVMSGKRPFYRDPWYKPGFLFCFYNRGVISFILIMSITTILPFWIFFSTSLAQNDLHIFASNQPITTCGLWLLTFY